jgi:hypothetical protein
MQLKTPKTSTSKLYEQVIQVTNLNLCLFFVTLDCYNTSDLVRLIRFLTLGFQICYVIISSSKPLRRGGQLVLNTWMILF